VSREDHGPGRQSARPEFSHVGAIRSEMDPLASVIVPNQTTVRDYEAHATETADGASLVGMIRSHTADGLVLMDLAAFLRSQR